LHLAHRQSFLRIAFCGYGLISYCMVSLTLYSPEAIIVPHQIIHPTAKLALDNLTAGQRTIIQQYSDWYTGRRWVCCYICYSEEGTV